MARTDTLGHFLTDVADAIREKKGTSETIQASDFDTEIENLPSGGDLSEYFNTEITRNTSMYGYANIIKKIPTITVANNVTSLAYFFGGMKAVDSLPKVICGNNVTNMLMMYANTDGNTGNNKITQLDVSGLDTSNVTNMSQMFYGLFALSQITGLSNFNTSNVTNMSNMFGGLRTITSIDISNFNTSSVTTMRTMFEGSQRLSEIIFGENFTTENVTGTGFEEMFWNTKITEIPSKIVVTSKATSLAGMFAITNIANAVIPQGWDVSNVTTISAMFRGSSYQSVDLSNCNFSNKLKNTSSLFYDGTNLSFADLRTIDFTNITSYNYMFGQNSTNGVPSNCEIIVADDTSKTWITSKFTWLTNVKTVAEYEAEQSE